MVKPLTRNSGFTLVELMVAIVVLAILIAIAAPSFTEQIRKSQMRTAMADFITAVAYARSQAVTRAKPIFVRSSNNTDWSGGWCVTEGADCSAPLRVFDGPKSITAVGNSGAYEFDMQGHSATGTTNELSLCSGSTGKKITILALGQALAQDCNCTSNNCVEE